MHGETLSRLLVAGGGMGVLLGLLWLVRWFGRRRAEGRRVLPAAGEISLLVFSGEHCAQCVPQEQQVDRTRSALVERGLPLHVLKVDALLEREQTRRFGVWTLPTTVVVDEGGRIVARNAGLTSAERLLEQCLAAGTPHHGRRRRGGWFLPRNREAYTS